VAKRAARQRAQRIQAQRQQNMGNSGTVQPPRYNPAQAQGSARHVPPAVRPVRGGGTSVLAMALFTRSKEAGPDT
jgi:hypothetical protein